MGCSVGWLEYESTHLFPICSFAKMFNRLVISCCVSAFKKFVRVARSAILKYESRCFVRGNNVMNGLTLCKDWFGSPPQSNEHATVCLARHLYYRHLYLVGACQGHHGAAQHKYCCSTAPSRQCLPLSYAGVRDTWPRWALHTLASMVGTEIRLICSAAAAA